ncbi:hypothetical protein TrRE_jg4649, partial [Triparma retinervis]
MDDIESITPSLPSKTRSTLPQSTIVTINKKKSSTTTPQPSLADNASIPGSQTIWLKTFGCAHNVSDSEYMAGLLNAYGYRLAPDRDKHAASCWVLNSCTVKDPSEASFVNLIREGQGRGKPIVVCGCVPQADRKAKYLKGVSVIGVQQIDRIVEAVETSLQGNTVRLLSKSTLPSLDLPKVRKNPLIEIIPLSTGCLGNCTYCKTKGARGKLGSYSPSAILARAQQAASEGVMEIWLSSEDTGAYGLDLGSSLTSLLDLLTTSVGGNVMFRIGMTNPPYILDQMEGVCRALNRPNVFSFLHVPVQSGSDNVLVGEGGMNREYTRGEFEKVVDRVVEGVEGVTVATDIICGFPNETEEDFEMTMDMMEKYRFGICNISQFYPRPGTPAARMKRIDTKIVKNRSRKISKFFNSLTPYAGMSGKTFDVWFGVDIDSSGTKSVGHTKSYVKVLVPLDEGLVGCRGRVRVGRESRFHVEGEVVGGT